MNISVNYHQMFIHYFLSVTKLIKDCLPTSCKVSKEANAAIAKVGSDQIFPFPSAYSCQAASVFVLYATSSANSVAQKSSRKTITGPDVVNAMSDMDFDKVTSYQAKAIC